MDPSHPELDSSLATATATIDPKGGCPVCGCELGTETTDCHLCASPHHTDCWNYNGGCATFGCPEGSPKTKLKELARVDTCPTCNRPPTGATIRCRSCENIHHAECWQQNKGCGTVGCASNPDAAMANPLPEKILLPKLRVGLFRGIYFVPPLTVVWCLAMELFSIMLMAGGSPVLAGMAFGAMVLGIAWAAITAERYNFNITLKAITKSKLIGEKEVWESVYVPFDTVQGLYLIARTMATAGQGAAPSTYMDVRDKNGMTYQLTPPVPCGGEDHQELQTLLQRMHAFSVMPCPQLAQARRLPRPRPPLEDPRRLTGGGQGS